MFSSYKMHSVSITRYLAIVVFRLLGFSRNENFVCTRLLSLAFDKIIFGFNMASLYGSCGLLMFARCDCPDGALTCSIHLCQLALGVLVISALRII